MFSSPMHVACSSYPIPQELFIPIISDKESESWIPNCYQPKLSIPLFKTIWIFLQPLVPNYRYFLFDSIYFANSFGKASYTWLIELLHFVFVFFKFCIIICCWQQWSMYNFYEGPSSQDNLPLWLPSLMQSQPQWRALVSRSGDSIWRPGTNRGHEVRDRAPTKYCRKKNINNLSVLGQMKLIPMPYSIF